MMWEPGIARIITCIYSAHQVKLEKSPCVPKRQSPVSLMVLIFAGGRRMVGSWCQGWGTFALTRLFPVCSPKKKARVNCVDVAVAGTRVSPKNNFD